MLKNKSIGEEQFKIASFQMDHKARATITSMAGFLQEIAGNHAHANGFGFEQMIENGHIWVLTRLKLNIHKYPAWGDLIDVSTWVVNREKFFSRRDFEIHNKENKLLVSASSGWMLLDIKTKRPKLVDGIEIDIPMHPEKFATQGELEKIEFKELMDYQSEYFVRYSDLDVNNHVNNIMYTRILLDSYSFDWRKNYIPESFEINYLAEAAYADELKITSTKFNQNDNSIIQQIRRKSDDKIICRAKFVWKSIDKI